MIGLDNKRIIVTGGAPGIGLGIVTAIIEAGGHVAILDLLPEPHPDCQALITESGKCHYFKKCWEKTNTNLIASGDITKPESLNPAFAKCVNALGGTLDGIVTNAGIGTDKPFLDHSLNDFQRVLTVNQNGTFFPAQLAVRQFMTQPIDPITRSRGSIVMISSQAASNKCPGHFLTAYGGTKGFVKSFCMQLSHELATVGIRSNTISPGYIETDLNLELAKIRPDVNYYFQEAPPMKRLGSPKDIAGGAVYLLSDAATYVTGIDLRIDGGMSAGSGLTR
ncbi:hypothetical protein LTR70_007541 [Exophiala xenobiotica]|uniref:Uncharacterized protein n=1 Tax=Lithohypha guttulata TaxID=1690604 RepID=A0ABR0K1M0_9EURO|nr:hypothetical protein LTR24_007880 [Lithohypha guttulata]KAK5313600.1 hypothetical protein LTR70_007541 [Exophiala xenobiotica]